ncbi:transcriptional regulator, BadM/Rrf2 family [Thermosyntropha lipolytica DSM 11003]|uniref:Transcriptional regulator, BadM/Rrf2 family n=1 Tax=Thermosyntropha lipolytica DSM 11003 TaxID=1123382 RepID=A0A1M5NFF2_9FIRM|nr:Rrf2 family transcriptional regulator [Thermosyntropha lipolytica]SHG88167.1 transcriptional regulator, BadM/Rrf2 family [Thermosyntropha lipolytica DSM 11003]
MKLSTRGRYGLRAMIDIARASRENEPVSIASIAASQGLSEGYLEQIMTGLKKAGLVRSSKGAKGGYTLGKSPGEITVGEIIRTLEGDMAPVDCVSQAKKGICDRADLCVTRIIWEEVRDAINQVLDKYSLLDLLENEQKLLKER